MTQNRTLRVWISGSKQFQKIAQQVSDLLKEMSLQVESEQALPLGGNVSQGRQERIQAAQGIIVLLGGSWNATVASIEGPLIAAHCSGGSDNAALWIVDVEAALMPPVLDGLAASRFPHSGAPLSTIPSARRTEVLAALRRSVAARLGLPEPQDLQYRQLESYRASQRDSLAEVPLKGFFTAQHPATARTFRFTELFVQLRLEWYRLPPDIRDQFRQLDAKLQDDKLSTAEHWKSWEARNALAGRYKTGGTFSLDEALSRFPQITLLGKPGSGKSSILHHLALRAHASGSELAILIKLSSLADKARPDEPLWPYILRKVESEHGAGVAAAFEERAPEGRALLLLDGVDEVKKELRPLLVRCVERLLLQHKGLRCVVTSRLATDCWLDNRIPHMQVAELNQEEVAEFVKKHKKCDNPATSEAESRRLIKTITSSHALRELAPNPLSLRLLCLLDQGADGLPVEQVDLYERAICTLLETWPANRVARRVNVTPEQLRRALASAAAWMHRRGQRDATRSEWLQQLAEALPRSPSRTAEQLAVCCMDAATLHSGILVEASPERFEFLHLTFTEYLAADHYIRQDQLVELAAQRSDSRYGQVIRFAVEILKQLKRRAEDAGRFLRMLAEEAPGTLDRIHHSQLPLVARCLGSGEGVPSAVVEDLFCFILDTARLPLATTTNAADSVLKAMQVDASPRMIAACAALEGHAVTSLAVAAARFVARTPVDRPEAQTLCRRWLSARDQAVGCYAALGLVRARLLLDEDLRRIAFHLAYVFHKDIAAEDEAEQALRQNPKLTAAAEALWQERQSDEAARLLTLIRVDDWPLVRFVVAKGSTEDRQAAARVALRSEQSAEHLVDLYLATVHPATHSHSGTEVVLHSIFPDSRAARKRLLLHYRRPLPEVPSWELRQDPERAKTAAAEAFLKETARSGEERARSREALLPDLQALLPSADADLCRRIATLGAGIDASSGLVADALRRCVDVGGVFRIWAIEEAFRLRLYDVAVAGTLARAESPGCLAAAMIGLRRQFQRGNSLQPLLDALAQQAESPLRDHLLLLCRVAERQVPATIAYPLLTAPLGDVPLPLRWWAAAETVLHAARTRSPLPAELSGPIFAFAFAEWKDPPDLLIEPGMGSSHPAWVPKFDSWREFISWPLDLKLPKLEGVQKTDAARQCMAWLRELVQAGAERNPIREVHSQWMAEAVAEDLSLLHAIIEDLVHPQDSLRRLAEWFLSYLLTEDGRAFGSRRQQVAPPASVSHLLLDEFLRVLDVAPGPLRWQMANFLRWRELGGTHLVATLESFLTASHSLQTRWTAFRWLVSLDEAWKADQSVLHDALVAEEPDLRLDAVEYAFNAQLSGLNYEEILSPLLELSVPPELRLEAASLWLRVPGSDRGKVVPTLIALLDNLAPAPHLHRYRVSGALRHIIGPVPEGEAQPIPYSRFEPGHEHAGLALWAAALLAELGGEDEALRSAAGSWLDALPPDTREREPWRTVRYRALSLLAHVGVGSVGPLVDCVLLRMVEEEGEFPEQSLSWIKDLHRLSMPILAQLLPFMLRGYTNQDKELAKWVLGCANKESEVRIALAGALSSVLREPQPAIRGREWEFLRLLHKFSLINARAAEIFISMASNEFPEKSKLAWALSMTAQPDVQRSLLSALQAHDVHSRVRLIDWILPLSLLREPGKVKLPSLSKDIYDLLREWLLDPDYGLRMEAGERLYRLGHHDDAVLQALRSCLYTPIEWSGSYYGDGARLTAVRILGELGQLSTQERLDSLIPVLDSAFEYHEVIHTLELLDDTPEHRQPVLDALVRALQRIQGSSWRQWQVVEHAFKLGLPQTERLPLLLRLLSESGHDLDDVTDALAVLLDVRPRDGEDASEESSDSSSNRDERARLRHGPLEGALRLAELSRWPDPLLDYLAAAVERPSSDLRLLEEEGRSLNVSGAASLLERFLQPHKDSALANLVRHACLFRFGPLVGVTESQLAYTLTW